MAILVLAIWTAPFAPAAPPAATTKDAATDALRQAAEKAMKDGKFDDAVSLLTKVVDEGNPGFQDFLMLAKSQEKLKHEREAAAAYRKVTELTSDSSEKRDERAAHREAKQKLATLDVIGGKIDVLLKETEKKLGDLVKDAEKAGDWAALGKALKLSAAMRQARGDEQVYYVEVVANKAYQRLEYKAVAGKKYRIRAVGRWRLSAKVECGPEGLKGPPPNSFGPAGALIMMVAQDKDTYKQILVGSDLAWTAPLSGILSFVINEDKLWEAAGKEDNEGSMHVLIERLD